MMVTFIHIAINLKSQVLFLGAADVDGKVTGPKACRDMVSTP